MHTIPHPSPLLVHQYSIQNQKSTIINLQSTIQNPPFLLTASIPPILNHQSKINNPKSHRKASPMPTSPNHKRGAPPGNHNAYKHGFYAIKPAVLSRLNTDIKGEFIDEIDVLRSLVDATLAIFSKTGHPTLEQCQTTLRGVSQAFDTMKSLYLTQKFLYNNQTTIQKIMEELSAIPPDED
jgi:hypothetical protein